MISVKTNFISKSIILHQDVFASTYSSIVYLESKTLHFGVCVCVGVVIQGHTKAVLMYCQGLTKSVKIKGEDQSVKRNAYFYYLAHFVYFSCISDRNLLIM